MIEISRGGSSKTEGAEESESERSPPPPSTAKKNSFSRSYCFTWQHSGPRPSCAPPPPPPSLNLQSDRLYDHLEVLLSYRSRKCTGKTTLKTRKTCLIAGQSAVSNIDCCFEKLNWFLALHKTVAFSNVQLHVSTER